MQTPLPLLLDESESPAQIMIKLLKRPVWSENKAKLITSYLRLFVFITKHGTYIDAFAGPQTEASEQAWTAQMVLDSEPKRLRHFHLFDNVPGQYEDLQRLAADNSERNVHVYLGDSNHTLPLVLPTGSIHEREATFCLLDQRTFQCEWQLCRHVSQLRPGLTKVEQFYFLANKWMDRALAAVSTEDTEQQVKAWLGQDDWRTFQSMSSHERRDRFVDKFKNELGYRSVKPWPIYGDDGGRGAVMYYMIHATDHPEAPKLMYRAYSQAVDLPSAINNQLELDLWDDSEHTYTHRYPSKYDR